MIPIYLKSQSIFISLKATCSDVPNLGVIEKPNAHGQVFLNAKAVLITGISHAGGNFLNLPGYKIAAAAAATGPTHGVSGSGFVGHAPFPNLQSAINYLAQYFQVDTCGTDTDFEIILIGRGYRHRPLAGTHGSIYCGPESSEVIVRPSVSASIKSRQKVDDYFRRLRNALQARIDRGEAISKIHLPAGGKIPIPAWFKDWCSDNDIVIQCYEDSTGVPHRDLNPKDQP